MPRLTVSLLGVPIFELDVEVERGADGTRTVEAAPVQTGVSGMADTAFGEQADPGTRISGFGLPLRQPEDRR